MATAEGTVVRTGAALPQEGQDLIPYIAEEEEGELGTDSPSPLNSPRLPPSPPLRPPLRNWPPTI